MLNIKKSETAGAAVARKKRQSDKVQPPSWEQLGSWVALVESGSVSAAAQRLGISQAGVSQHVRQLEEGFGTSLLDRSTRPARPTASGQRLFEQAHDLLTRAGQMADAVRLLSRNKRSLLRLGCVDSFAAAIGPAMVRGLTGWVQRLRLISGINPELADQFERHQLDVLVTTDDPRPVSGQVWLPLFSEQFLLALPPRLVVPPLPSLAQLHGLRPFMNYSTRSKMGALVDAYLGRHAPGVERAFEFDATDPLLSLVSEDLGLALTTPLCLWQSRFHAQSVQLLPLSAVRSQGKPCPPLSRTFWLVFRPDELGPLANDIAAMIRVAARDLQRQMATELKLPPELIGIEDSAATA